MRARRGQGLAQPGGIRWRPARIGDPLRTLVERALLEKLLALSIPASYEMLTRDRAALFRECLRPLKGGDLNRGAIAEREALAKTGWGSYPIWRERRPAAWRERRERRRRAWRWA